MNAELSLAQARARLQDAQLDWAAYASKSVGPEHDNVDADMRAAQRDIDMAEMDLETSSSDWANANCR